jgi:hypothetical protein
MILLKFCSNSSPEIPPSIPTSTSTAKRVSHFGLLQHTRRLRKVDDVTRAMNDLASSSVDCIRHVRVKNLGLRLSLDIYMCLPSVRPITTVLGL